MREFLQELKEKGIVLEESEGKLKVHFLRDDVDESLIGEIAPRKQEILDYLAKEDEQFSDIKKVAEQEDYPISHAQKRLWILSQFDTESVAYNVPAQIPLEGAIDREAFISAINSTIERHESLRTVFIENDEGEVRQRILSSGELEFEVELVDFREEKDPDAKIQEYVEAGYYKPFDLEKGPLVKAALLQASDDRYAFYYNLHHIITDGWSQNILAKDVMEFYRAALAKEPSQLEPLTVQYKDYTAWHLAQVNGDEAAIHRDYWTESLAGELPQINLAAAKQRPAVKSSAGFHLGTYVSAKSTTKLRDLCQSGGATLFMGVMAVWNALYYKYSGQRDLVTGTVIAGRDHEDLLEQIGFYVNTLALRFNVDPDAGFSALLDQVKAKTLEGYEHPAYPFDLLVEDLKVSRDTSRNPIFDVMLALQNVANNTADVDLTEEQQRDVFGYQEVVSRFDLEFTIHEIGNCLHVGLVFNSDLFERQQAETLLKHYRQLLEALVADSDKPLKNVNILSEKESSQLLVDFNRTQVDFPEQSNLVELFQDQTRLNADKIALIWQDVQLTYQELDERSNQLAYYLLKASPISSEDLIGIELERSEWLIVAILAVLKTGGAYVPVSPEYPQERRDYIKTSTQCKIHIDQVCLNDFLQQRESFDKTALNRVIKGTDLAYIMYTSGSTGEPKGVMVEHMSVVRLACNPNYINIKTGDRILALSNYAFDGSTFDLFMPLLNGATIVLSSKDIFLNLDKFDELIEQAKVDTFFTTTVFFNSLADVEMKSFGRLKNVLFGGEQVSVNHVKRFQQKFPNIQLRHVYGPTENTTFSTWYPVESVTGNEDTIPIGSGISNSTCYVLNDQLQPVPVGVEGEIYVGGTGVARGYFGRADLTAERFVQNPFAASEKLYRTGDYGKWNFDGNIAFIGRKDAQVKIRGYRIELGEIEHAIQELEAIKAVVVLASDHAKRGKELVAYYTVLEQLSASEIKEELLKKLPHYLVPAHFVALAEMPITANGKVNKRALPAVDEVAFETDVNYVEPKGEIENELTELLGDILGIPSHKIGVNDNFFDLGATSILLLRSVGKINKKLGANITIVDLFQYPSIGELVRVHFGTTSQKTTPVTPANDDFTEIPSSGSNDVAIIGLSARFNTSVDIEDFWNKLVNEEELVHFYSEEEIAEFGIDLTDPQFEKYVGIDTDLKEAECFDHRFFGYSYDEAKMMDPQTRLMHQQTWLALEDAGCDPKRYDGKIGVYLTASDNAMWRANAMLHPNENVNPFFLSQLADKNFVHTLISYNMDLRGPSLHVDTACSSSLVATHMACQSILAGECSMAVSGGVRYDSEHRTGYIHQEGMIASRDGHCRTFDVEGSGTISGSGTGVIVLKKLENAIADNDNIYAVIRGSAINNDGRDKVGYTAPSVRGQAECIKRAQRIAKVQPESISYIEAHGTATNLGDPIEIEALNLAFNYSDEKYCTVGSVKSNVGHLGAGAGVAGVIKTALALKNKVLPASLHYNAPNPEINFEAGPFTVQASTSIWESQTADPLRAGVSSFGIGGTNAHLILEEYRTEKINREGKNRQLLMLSAKTPASLDLYATKLASHLQSNDVCLDDLAYTLSTGRSQFEYRKTYAIAGAENAVELLSQPINDVFPSESKGIVFMFPGQGSQYVQMALGVYQEEPVFRKIVDEGLALIEQKTGQDYRAVLGYDGAINATTINQTVFTQPLLFVVEYALAQQLMHWGIVPDQMIGHSLGEYVAACVSGVISFEDGIELIVERAHLMDSLDTGSMVSVGAAVEQVRELLDNKISIAAINTPDACVVSGETALIEKLEAQLEDADLPYIRLKTSHAFHSAMMDEMLPAFEEKLESIDLKVPERPFISNRTGLPITDRQATSKSYWSEHLRQTVEYSKGITHLLDQGDYTFVEVGPGRTLSTFLTQQGSDTNTTATCLIRHPKSNVDDATFLLNGVGNLWEQGVAIDFEALYEGQDRSKISAPGYQFEKFKFPVKADPFGDVANLVTSAPHKRTPEEWFYLPNWKRSRLAAVQNEKPQAKTYLFFSDSEKWTERAGELLLEKGNTVIEVKRGTEYAGDVENGITISAKNPDDFERLFEELKRHDHIPDQIVYGWEFGGESQSEIVEAAKSVLSLCKEIIAADAGSMKLTYVSKQALNVNGFEKSRPIAATAAMVARVAAQEYPQMFATCLDIDASEFNDKLVNALLGELESNLDDTTVAYRNGIRWVQFYENVEIDSTASSHQFSSEKTYLILGGLGKVGLTLAKHLVEKYDVQVVLTGRRELPNQDEVQEQLNNGTLDAGTAKLMGDLFSLKKSGKQIQYYQTDVSNLKSLSTVVQKIEAEVGTIAGVIHAAGNTSTQTFQPIEKLSQEILEAQFGPKVQGTQNLYEVFKNKSPEFVWITSSLSAVLGGLTFGAYAAANRFIDVFTEKISIETEGWLAVNLDGITEDRIHAQALTQVFERSLQLGYNPQVIVSVDDLNAKPSAKVEEESIPNVASNIEASLTSRPRLKEDYKPPASLVEEKMCEVWQQFFKIDKIGSADDFFSLGGDSLKAMTIVKQIERAFDQQISLHDFYQDSTVSGVSKLIETTGFETSQTEEEDDATIVKFYSFPPHIGMSLDFKPLVKNLPAAFDCHLFYSSGIGKGEAFKASIAEEAVEFRNLILSENRDHKVVLMGYSFGCYLAFETAKLMEQIGFDNYELIIVDMPADIRTWIERKQGETSNDLIIQKAKEFFSSDEMVRIEQVVENNYQMILRHEVHGVLGSKIHCIEGTNQNPRRHMEGWSAHTSASITHTKFHCAHDEMLDHVYYPQLLEIIQSCANDKKEEFTAEPADSLVI
jgi:polyketide synthase PksJ